MSTPLGGSYGSTPAEGTGYETTGYGDAGYGYADAPGEQHASGASAYGASHPPPDVSNIGVGDALRGVTQDLSKLVNQEITLAKLEVQQEVKKAGKIAAGFAVAGVAGYFAVLFLSLTLAFLLASLFNSLWLGALVVTLIWGIAGAVLFVRARDQAKSLNPVPEKTVETLKEDKEWLKTRNS